MSTLDDRAGVRLPQANASQTYDVTAADLPLACPMPKMALWNSHPRVYLPIEKTGMRSARTAGPSSISSDSAASLLDR